MAKKFDMIKNLKEKNNVKGTCGTGGEMSPLSFLYLPKTQMNSTTMTLRLFFCPKNMYNMLPFEQAKILQQLEGLMCKTAIHSNIASPIQKKNSTTVFLRKF